MVLTFPLKAVGAVICSNKPEKFERVPEKAGYSKVRAVRIISGMKSPARRLKPTPGPPPVKDNLLKTPKFANNICCCLVALRHRIDNSAVK